MGSPGGARYAESFMDAIDHQLRWIDTQRERMVDLVAGWSRINSYTHNLPGIQRLAAEVAAAFKPLGGECRRVDLPPYRHIDDSGRIIERHVAPAVSILIRPEAPRRILLSIHLDTVYPPRDDGEDHRIQTLDNARLRGPGVADAKGGLAVMLIALQALEHSALAQNLGLHILLNTDEEIGSPASADLLMRAARDCDLGLVYEPALEDGSFVAARKGSGNFTLTVRGRSAHAGRDFAHGRNAAAALARIVTQLAGLTDIPAGLTVNIGQILGGGPVNVVPDFALCRFNVRFVRPQQQAQITSAIRQIIADANHNGHAASLHGSFSAPPKPVTPAYRQLLDAVADCGKDLDLPVTFRDTGGVCDGNRLAAAGLVNVDTLGPRGGAIHSDDEYLECDSLTERARLSALLMMRLATGALDWPQ